MSNRHTAAPSITACPDGPLLVRGAVDVLTGTGEEITRHRKTIALCRCGASTIKPYCDGTHKLINFTTENPPISPPRPRDPDANAPGTTASKARISDGLGSERTAPNG